MHIPDGYLSPVFSLSTGVLTIPTWALAAHRVRSVLNNRTIPLLSIFAAFSFTIMMFNIPVPGGTTAHAVGGTLMAIVLGPWAAVIGVSIALIIQALFFGDGGVLAIFANCLNMGILLPFMGYFFYRLIAGRSPLLSVRRIWAAGIASYLAITVAAVAVGVELGVQPLLFSEGGRPLYSPYGLEATLPAMLLSHLFGAALVEGLVTALGLAYIQKNHPYFLTSLRAFVSGGNVERGEQTRMPQWQIYSAAAVGIIVVLLIAGFATSGGSITHLFGADWSSVNWADVGMMLLIVLILALVLVPLGWFLLPSSIRNVGTAFLAIAIIAPLGLITPGIAFGEGSSEDVEQVFHYVPKGLQQLEGIFSAPLAGYNIPLPFFSDANAPLWHAAIGYELSGIIGILLLGGIVFGLLTLLKRLRAAPSEPVETRQATPASETNS
ncbi:cobalt transporter CbiM [Ktedonospora formicarum]|uniref:Cobalt transporter CbiM n=1 Tax=Ktedonospora formicarum TaxID=2778364 RepID=A0A8J3HV17_9CHLR|nr:cobalt transporter CbiM [Ktedonospora formicarum]GHO42496.1 cobalt transporter CbiM [Ktedonospora formicarum]